MVLSSKLLMVVMTITIISCDLLTHANSEPDWMMMTVANARDLKRGGGGGGGGGFLGCPKKKLEKGRKCLKEKSQSLAKKINQAGDDMQAKCDATEKYTNQVVSQCFIQGCKAKSMKIIARCGCDRDKSDFLSNFCGTSCGNLTCAQTCDDYFPGTEKVCDESFLPNLFCDAAGNQTMHTCMENKQKEQVAIFTNPPPYNCSAFPSAFDYFSCQKDCYFLGGILGQDAACKCKKSKKGYYDKISGCKIPCESLYGPCKTKQ